MVVMFVSVPWHCFKNEMIEPNYLLVHKQNVLYQHAQDLLLSFCHVSNICADILI